MSRVHQSVSSGRLAKISAALCSIALALMAVAAGAWLHTAQAGAGASAAPPSAAKHGELDDLVARCERAMLQGRCAVMAPGPTAAPESRVFIAGSGEVDAGVYAELRRYGDAMCSEVRTQCRAAWSGAECRIARALYP